MRWCGEVNPGAWALQNVLCAGQCRTHSALLAAIGARARLAGAQWVEGALLLVARCCQPRPPRYLPDIHDDNGLQQACFLGMGKRGELAGVSSAGWGGCGRWGGCVGWKDADGGGGWRWGCVLWPAPLAILCCSRTQLLTCPGQLLTCAARYRHRVQPACNMPHINKD